GLLEGERHRLQVRPILRAKGVKGLQVVLLHVFPVAGLAKLEEPELVVPKERDGARRPRQVDHLVALGSAVDEVPKENQPVAVLQVELLEKLPEFDVAA